MTDPVSTLRALDHPVTIGEAANLIALPGRPSPAPRKTAMLLLELGFEPRHEVEANGHIINRWHPPAPLADHTFGPIDPKPGALGRSMTLTAMLSCLIMLGVAALAGLL